MLQDVLAKGSAHVRMARRSLVSSVIRRIGHGRVRCELDDSDIQCSTVHEAKGKQFDAVVVVIPPDRAPANHTTELFDAWRGRGNSEANVLSTLL